MIFFGRFHNKGVLKPEKIGLIFLKLQSVHSSIEIQRPSLCIVIE